MPYNLFIAYDLIPPGQNYEAVRQRIRELGQWHQFQVFTVLREYDADSPRGLQRGD